MFLNLLRLHVNLWANKTFLFDVCCYKRSKSLAENFNKGANMKKSQCQCLFVGDLGHLGSVFIFFECQKGLWLLSSNLMIYSNNNLNSILLTSILNVVLNEIETHAITFISFSKPSLLLWTFSFKWHLKSAHVNLYKNTQG